MNQYDRPSNEPNNDKIRHRIADAEESQEDDWPRIPQSELSAINSEEMTLEAPFEDEEIIFEDQGSEVEFEGVEDLPSSDEVTGETQEIEAISQESRIGQMPQVQPPPRHEHLGVPSGAVSEENAAQNQPPLKAIDLEYYIRMCPRENRFAGATFKERESIAIGSERDCDVFVPHDLVEGNHAEITYTDGLFAVQGWGGNTVLVNNEVIQAETILCRGDELTLVGPGGPSFIVEMLKPDRAPSRGGQSLPRFLRIFGWLIEPSAKRLSVSPLLLLVFFMAVLTPFGLGVLLLSIIVFGSPA